MASVSPLTLRFVAEEWKNEVPSPPHDALSPEDRRQHLTANPRSYLGVTRGPEDGDQAGDGSPESALTAGRQSLEQLLAEGVFEQPNDPAYYVYRLNQGGHQQSGLVCGVATADYDAGTIRIHEQINQTRADHLARHLKVVGAQSSPIALAFRSSATVADVIDQTTSAGPPFLDISDEDGLRQRLWRISGDHTAAIQGGLADQPLYLIDGHHRAAAASADLRLFGPTDDTPHVMLSVAFPIEELQNQAFHRVVTDIEPEDLVAALTQRFEVRWTDDAQEVLDRAPAELAMAVSDGSAGSGPRWLLFEVALNREDPLVLENIDPIRLSQHVIGPVLGTDESGADHRLSYRPGVVTLDGLAGLSLQPGEVFFLMRPVPMQTLMAASDRGQTMPPKSTYFVPKVRSGLFVRLVDPTLR